MNMIQDFLQNIIGKLKALSQRLLPKLEAPFLAADYRQTPFARDTGAVYADGIMDEPVFKLYNMLRRSRVAIEAIAHPNHARDAHLCWQDTLIIHEIDRVALQNGQWVIGPGSRLWKEGLDLNAAVAEVLDDVFDDRPGFEPGSTVLLLDRSLIAPEDRLEAEAMPLFLLYDNDEDRFQVLKTFCK